MFALHSPPVQALPMYTVVVGAYNDDGSETCSILTTTDAADDPKLAQFNIPTPANPLVPSKTPAWANYFKGVVANFHGICIDDKIVLFLVLYEV